MDVIIIGGGIAGCAAAYFLSKNAKVTLIEREDNLGYHSSGRSAEQFTVGISAPTMRKLAQASRPFLLDPPPGFTSERLVSARGCLTVGVAGQEARLEKIRAQILSVGADARLIDKNEALSLFPALRPEGVNAGVYEPDAMDIDANTLLHSYVRGAKANGATIITSAEVNSICRVNDKWEVKGANFEVAASLVLNSAGAWVDVITELAGLAPIGLTPYRRTAFTFAPPAGLDTSKWPHVSNLGYQWYISPGSGRLMGSRAEAVAVSPGDVFPDDIDVAEGIHNIEQDTTFAITRPLSKWAGLRNFVNDRDPVVGTRPDAPGFFWMAGQGGCGILTSPGLGQAIAAIMLDHELPALHRSLGVTRDDLAPDRATLMAQKATA